MKDKPLYYVLVGHLWISIPVFVLLFGLPIVAWQYFSFLQSFMFKIPLMIASILVSLVLAWGCWAILITKWRIWAFNSLPKDKWIELKELAILYLLIWPSDSDFNSTEIRNQKEEDVLDVIEENLSQLEENEIILLEKETPAEIGFQINRRSILFELFIMVSFSIFGFIVIIILDWPINLLGIFFIGISFYNWKEFKSLKHINSSESLLIVNEKSVFCGLPEPINYTWESISDFEVDQLKHDLLLTTENKDFSIPLSKFKIKDISRFNKQLHLFHRRSRLAKGYYKHFPN